MRERPLETALCALVRFLDSEKVPYMVIGAMAGLVWGLQRATFDVDLTLWAQAREKELAEKLSAAFQCRAPTPVDFLADTGVLPLLVQGVEADIVFGRLPFEEKAIQRARSIKLGGRQIRVCGPEDLIVHKIISERPKDREDIRQLIAAAGKNLDRPYLDPIVKSLAQELARPRLWQEYLALF